MVQTPHLVVWCGLWHVPMDEKSLEPGGATGAAESSDGPRPKAPTLVGVGPASGPVVVGAVARPDRIPTPAPTNRALFDAAGRAEDEVDDAWPDAPPETPPPSLVESPAAVTLGPSPAAEPALAVDPAPTAIALPEPPSLAGQPLRPEVRARRRAWIAALLAAAVGACIVGAWHARAVPSAPTPGPANSTAGTASSNGAPELPSAAATPASTAATPVPTPASSAPTTAPLPPFDAVAADSALRATAKAVARCRHGKVYGRGQASVTFGGDGAVTRCILSGRFKDTPAGACVAAALSAVHAAPFAGPPQTVVHPFVVAPR